MDNWILRRGDGDKKVSFRGKMGLTRQLRRDELLIAKTESISEDHVSSNCQTVIGRKAWRVNEAGLKFINDKLSDLNEQKLNQLQFLELMEIEFESGK